MNIKKLVEKYFDQIEIEDTNYIHTEGATSDAAYILLNIPIKMLEEYSRLKGQNRKFPDGTEFWRETKLGKRLRNSDIYHNKLVGHEPLEDILEFLNGDICYSYQKLDSHKGKIRLSITEIPEFYNK